MSDHQAEKTQNDPMAGALFTELRKHPGPLQHMEGWWMCSGCSWEDPERAVSITGLDAYRWHVASVLASAIRARDYNVMGEHT